MLNKQYEDAWTVADAKAKLPEVLRCADELPVAWLSTITLNELEYGIALITEWQSQFYK